MSRTDNNLAERLARLEQVMEEAGATGLDGQMLAERIRGDLERQINSAWLTCTELVHRHERQQQCGVPMAAKAAMDYAQIADDGLAFLKRWQEGDFDTIRREWPEAPEAVYVSRDLVI